MKTFIHSEILDSIATPVFCVRFPALKIAYFNNSFHRLFPDVACGDDVERMIDSSISRPFRDMMRRSWKSDKADPKPDAVVFQANDSKWYEQRASVCGLKGGESLVVCELRDVTAHTTLETAHQRLQALFENLFENAPHSMELYDREGYLIKANEPHFILYGQKRGDPLTDSVIKKYNPLKDPMLINNEYFRSKIESLLSGNIERLPAFQFTSREGIERFREDLEPWIRPTLIPIMDNGELVNFFIINEDHTELIHVKEKLNEKEVTTAGLLDLLFEGVIFTGPDDEIILLNATAEKIMQISTAAVEGRNINEVVTIVSDPQRKPIAVSARDPVTRKDCIFVSASGEEHYFHYSHAPVFAAERLIGSLFVFQDVTALKKDELGKYRIQKLESLGILAGGIAHDFNNLLSVILGNVSLLEEDMDPGGNNINVFRNIETAIDRARDLTVQLLTFSKGGSPVKEKSSIAELVRDTAEFSLRGTGFSVAYSIDPDLWPVDIDRGQISQVIQNILLNAVQAVSRKKELIVTLKNLELTAENVLRLPQGKYVMLSIQDFGCGMEKEDLARIFDPYFTTKPSGSGLGATISYSIVKKHGGTIEVSSEPGAGSTFAIYLPASPADADAAADGARHPEMIMAAPNVRAQTRFPHRILVLEDEPQILLLLEKLAERLSLKMVLTQNGKKTVEIFDRYFREKNPFDLVLLDLTIKGGMGGIETLEKLRSIDKDVKAVVMSGYSTDDALANYRAHGFFARLPKPFSYIEFKEVLQTYIDGGRSPADSA